MRQQAELKANPQKDKSVLSDAEISRLLDIQMKRYLVWLLDHAQHDWVEDVKEIHSYAKQARRIVEVDNRQIQIFAPFRSRYSALHTLTRSQGITLILAGLAVLLCLFLNWENTLVTIISLITLGYLAHLTLDGLLIMSAMNEQGAEDISDAVVASLNDAPWPPYTILCPLYHEALVVPQFVEAMKALDYPPSQLQILFLTEEDDLETRATIRAMRLPSYFQIVTVPVGYPRTKPRACNYGLTEAIGYYTVIYDAEDKPDPLQLKKAVLTFAKHDESLACVQARLNFYNPRQNLLTRWFTAEYSQWFDMMLPGLQKCRLVIPLGGTSNHFVTQTLRALGGWDAFNVTEDCDLGLRLAHFGLKTVILQSTTYEEATSQVKNWIRQRSRWIKGYMQTYLIHIRNPLSDIRNRRWRELFSLYVIVGGKTIFLLINPPMWIMTLMFLIFQPAIYNELFPTLTLYMSIFCFIAGNFFYCYVYMVSCAWRKQYDIVPWMLLLPIYWVLNSIAAYIAFYELVVRPHYWQKTQHGLHLLNKEVVEFSEDKLEEEHKITEKAISEITQRQSHDLISIHILQAIPSISVEDAIHTMVARHKPALLPSELIELESDVIESDSWFTRASWIAVAISLLARWFFLHLDKIFDYPDTIAHLQIGRQILSGIPPATITVLGGNWLPLSYYSLIPLLWLDAIGRTEVASTLFAMISFIACAMYIFLIGRRLTRNSVASFVGTLIFVLNPDMLYVQSMPLPTTMSLLALVVSCYYLLAWAQTESLSQLIKAGLGTFLATLLTYEGWALVFILFAVVFCVGFSKRYTRQRIVSDLMLYGMLSFLGIITMVLWEWITVGDPLFFLHALGPYPGLSLDKIMAALPSYGLLLMNHVGLLLCVLVVPGIVLLAIRYHTWPALLSMFLLLITPLFYFLVAIYLGQLDPFGNLTYSVMLQQQIVRTDIGALITVIVAILVTVQSAYLLQKIKMPAWKNVACITLLLIILGQSIWIGTHGLTLQRSGPQMLPQSYHSMLQPISV